MGIRLKVIILVLVILLAISFSIIFSIQRERLSLFQQYTAIKESLTQENKTLTNKLNVALKETKQLQDRLGVIQEELERLTESNQEFQRKYELVDSERKKILNKLSSYQQLEEEIKFFKEENNSLKEQLAALTASRGEFVKLEPKIKPPPAGFEAEEELFFPPPEDAEPNEEKPQTSDELSDSESVDLPPIVVSSSSVPSKRSQFILDGKIANVNREYNFVVIDLGQEKGVKEGMVFEVYREGWFLGKIEVIQTRQDIAACDIVQAETLLNVGDNVRY
ncbi:MAG: hypothetical protein ABIC18_04700 [Candidatus Omnitrophota bacterium]